MKVLYITHCTDLSGANRCLIQMLIELRDNHSVEPFVIYPRVCDTSSRTLTDALKEHNIEGLSHRLTCFQRSETGWPYKLYYIFFGFAYLISILYKLRHRKFDLVHSNSSVIDTGLYIAKWRHIPHIWHFREVAALSFGMKSLLGDNYQRWIYGKSDKIITISNDVKHEFKSFINEDKMEVVHDGIMPPITNHFPNHNSQIIDICIVGRVEPNKNQMEAVQAVELLHRDVRHNVRLHIIGNYCGEYGQHVFEYVKENRLEKIIIFHGVRTDVQEMLQDMHVGLMLSKHEGFGRVTVEYMMHKMCVIASNTSANPEIIQDGKNGMLYEIGSPQDLANKITRLYNDRNLVKTLSEKGYEDAMSLYLSTINSSKVFALYQSIVKS